MKCKLSLLLTSFILCIILAFAPTLTTSAAVGVGTLWDGTFNVEFLNPYMYLKVNRYYSIAGSGSTSVPQSGVIYESSDNVNININSNSTDVYLNGGFRIRVNVNVSHIGSSYDFGILTPHCDPVVLDDIYINIVPVSKADNGVTSYDIIVEFDNYYINQSTISVPLNIGYTLDCWVNNATNSWFPEAIMVPQTVVNDYHGTIMQYDSLEDVPSLDGYFAEQNQTIINQSQTQNNLTTEQNTLIQNQTNQQHQDSQAQINQSIANTDTMVNGFDTTESDKTSASLESNFSSLENAEADSIDFAQTALRGFSIPAGGIQGLAEGMTASMSLVTSMAQAIYEASEGFGTIIIAVFSLIIIGMVIGLAKFMR